MLYWILLAAIIVLMIVGVVVQNKFNKTAVKYSAIPTKNGKTAAEVARLILEEHNIEGIVIARGKSVQFSDNFNPQNKTVTLSQSVYDSTSIAAIAIAAHEVGHVIQYSKQTTLIKIRTTLVKPVMITQQIGAMIFQMGFMFALFGLIFVGTTAPFWIWSILIAGAVMAGASFIFSLVTLPVEYDASKRAKENLVKLGIISEKNDEEYKGAEKVLSAAAKTYLVGFLSALTSLLFYIFLIIAARN